MQEPSKEHIIDTLRAANEALSMTKYLVQGQARQKFVEAVMIQVSDLVRDLNEKPETKEQN